MGSKTKDQWSVALCVEMLIVARVITCTLQPKQCKQGGFCRIILEQPHCTGLLYMYTGPTLQPTIYSIFTVYILHCKMHAVNIQRYTVGTLHFCGSGPDDMKMWRNGMG